MEYSVVNKAIWSGCTLTWNMYYDIIFCEKAVPNCVHTYTLYNHNYVKLFIFKRWNECSLCLLSVVEPWIIFFFLLLWLYFIITYEWFFSSVQSVSRVWLFASDYYGRPNRINEYYCRLPKDIHILIHRAGEHVTFPNKKESVNVIKLRISRERLSCIIWSNIIT